MTTLREIPLANIKPNSKNPRRHMDPRKLDELAASIRQKGVIEPIIVRKVQLNVHDKGRKAAGLASEHAEFEIVAGERRYKASLKAGLVTIPAIVRELTDDEAYDFMLIENLQRDDLTDREEAESFKAYVKVHGDGAEISLAEKTGISPAYIRARVRVLELPAKVLKAWDEGKLVFGHLQQLLRVAGDPKALKEMSDRLTGSNRWGDGISTVGQVRRWINDLAPALSGAFFPMKEACAGCGSSSIVQKDLFDVDADKARCLNPACFKKRQNDYLAGHWMETALAKAHGTNGFRFEDRRGGYNYHNFRYGPRPAEKCKACPNFVTIINVDGTVDEPQVCFGKDECFKGATREKKEGPRAAGQKVPRASWHGEYFRDRFVFSRLPATIEKASTWLKEGAGADLERLSLYGLARGNHVARSAVEKALGLKQHSRNEELLKIVLGAPKESFEKALRAGISGLILEEEPKEGAWSSGFGRACRAIAAERLGIRVDLDFAVDKDYLEKKTKAEICAFIRKQGLLKDTKVRQYWEKKLVVGWGCVESLKKPQLIDLILKSGVALVGKVPAEILK